MSTTDEPRDSSPNGAAPDRRTINWERWCWVQERIGTALAAIMALERVAETGADRSALAPARQAIVEGVAEEVLNTVGVGAPDEPGDGERPQKGLKSASTQALARELAQRREEFTLETIGKNDRVEVIVGPAESILHLKEGPGHVLVFDLES